MSQHDPTVRQVEALETLFPGHELVMDQRSFDSADQIVERFHAARGDEMVVVAPLMVTRELVRRGLHPLYAEMRQVDCKHTKHVEVRAKGRCYRFVCFSRVESVDLKLSKLKPPSLGAVKATVKGEKHETTKEKKHGNSNTTTTAVADTTSKL